MLVYHSVTVISPPPPPPPPPSPPPPLLAISHLTTQDTCRLPPLPENANYSTVPESISAKSTISLVCQNGYLLVTDGNLTCQESGTWSGEVQCQREGHTLYRMLRQLSNIIMTTDIVPCILPPLLRFRSRRTVSKQYNKIYIHTRIYLA